MHSIFGSVQWLFLVKSFLIFVINVFNDKCSLFSWHHNNHLCLKNNPKHEDSNLKMSEGTASPCDVVTPNHSVTVSKTHDNSLACPCGWTVHSDTVVRTNTRSETNVICVCDITSTSFGHYSHVFVSNVWIERESSVLRRRKYIIVSQINQQSNDGKVMELVLLSSTGSQIVTCVGFDYALTVDDVGWYR